jgi:hypothetical protein
MQTIFVKWNDLQEKLASNEHCEYIVRGFQIPFQLKGTRKGHLEEVADFKSRAKEV